MNITIAIYLLIMKDSYSACGGIGDVAYTFRLLWENFSLMAFISKRPIRLTISEVLIMFKIDFLINAVEAYHEKVALCCRWIVHG
jgi:hypothetical protein